ncbi:YcgN family cysteine cluster protein [Maricaulis sp. CAU 1757]
MSEPFWTVKSLEEMSPAEWESLCDGCGKCCLVQLEDEDSGVRLKTDIACRLYDCEGGGCRDYANRKAKVPDCVILTPQSVRELDWMPKTCAYRLIAEGRDLFDWHPLITGDPDSTDKAGMSVRGQVISEDEFDSDDWGEHIVLWPGEDDPSPDHDACNGVQQRHS